MWERIGPNQDDYVSGGGGPTDMEKKNLVNEINERIAAKLINGKHMEHPTMSGCGLWGSTSHFRWPL